MFIFTQTKGDFMSHVRYSDYDKAMHEAEKHEKLSQKEENSHGQ